MATDVDIEKPDDPDESVAFWMGELEAAKAREEQYRKQGDRILKIYDGSLKDQIPFNILFSNTETMYPALYSTVPIPVVQRRFKDADPLGLLASKAATRMLEFLLDTNLDGYDTFDDAMRAAVLDGILPGRGWTTVDYHAKFGELAGEATDDGEEPPEAATPYVTSEFLCLESRAWNAVYHGYAKKWSKVPWVAYELYVDKDEATKLLGADLAGKLQYADKEEAFDDRNLSKNDTRFQGERKTACLYQIWDKDGGRKVRYYAPSYATQMLKEEDDPLGLTGFFNCPKPLAFVEKTHSLVPTALYLLYESQANELNELTLRMKRIAKAIKARGVYDSELGDEIKKLFEADDNELIPCDKSSSLAAEKGLDNAIWFAPIEQLITTLMQLQQARERVKQVIYEITGISDILRGQSSASETATAQQIKTQWGSLRLKRPQSEVQRYARDLIRMLVEMAATNFSEETWAKMTGLPFILTSTKQQLLAIQQASQMTGQPLDPQTAQALQQPVWGEVLAILKDDFQRAYRVDIETNSTIAPEAADDQKQITELMTVMGQFLNGMGPLVAQGVMPFEAAQAMLLAISRRFRFGSEIEDLLMKMKPPKPQDDGAKQAAQAQAQQAQQEGQMKLQELQLKMQAEQAKMQQAQQLLEMELVAARESSQR